MDPQTFYDKILKKLGLGTEGKWFLSAFQIRILIRNYSYGSGPDPSINKQKFFMISSITSQSEASTPPSPDP